MSSTTIRISQQLVDEAKETARWTERSVPGQIEHWAHLGKVFESHLPTASTIALKKAAFSNSKETLSQEVASAFALLQKLQKNLPTSGLTKALAQKHSVLYEGDPNNPEQIIQIDSSGKRTVGKLVGRRFAPLKKA